MEDLFKAVVEQVALGVETGAALFIAFGAIEAFYHVALRVVRGAPSGRPAATTPARS